MKLGRKVFISLLVISIVLMAGYKAKIEWVDTYKERQTANLWLLLMQEGKLERAHELVDEAACRRNGFDSFDELMSYAQRGYFEGASITKMYLNDSGEPVARIKLSGNPKIGRMLLRVDHSNNKFQIKEIKFIAGEHGPVGKIFDWLGI